MLDLLENIIKLSKKNEKESLYKHSSVGRDMHAGSGFKHSSYSP